MSPPAQMAARGARGAPGAGRGSDPPAVTPSPSTASPPRGAAAPKANSAHEPCQPQEPVPAAGTSPPAIPPTVPTRFLFPFPARRISSSPRQSATPGGAWQEARGVGFIAVPQRTAGAPAPLAEPGTPLPDVPPLEHLPRAGAGLCPESVPHPRGERPLGTGAELRPRWGRLRPHGPGGAGGAG